MVCPAGFLCDLLPFSSRAIHRRCRNPTGKEQLPYGRAGHRRGLGERFTGTSSVWAPKGWEKRGPVPTPRAVRGVCVLHSTSHGNIQCHLIPKSRIVHASSSILCPSSGVREALAQPLPCALLDVSPPPTSGFLPRPHPGAGKDGSSEGINLGERRGWVLFQPCQSSFP